MRTTRSRVNHQSSQRLGLEHLEARQLLTMLADYAFRPASVVPQDSTGVVIPFYAVESFTQPQHGTLTDEGNGELTYKPNAGYVGADEFTVETIYGSQIHSLTVSETVYAVPDWARIKPNSVAQPIGVLGNDYVLGDHTVTNGGQDRGGTDVVAGGWGHSWRPATSELRIVSVAPGQHGTVSVSDDGRSLEFSPEAGFVGSEVVEYTVEDALGHTSVAQLTIEVSNTPVSSTNYTSESEFVHHQIDAWLSAYASTLHFYQTVLWNDVTLFASDATPDRDVGRGTELSPIVEGDIVKREGDWLFVASGDTVSIIDMTTPTSPSVVSSMAFEGNISELFVSDGRLTVISQIATGSRLSERFHSGVGVQIDQIDVDDPYNLTRVFSTEVDATYVDSRIIGDSLYLVSRINPSLPFPTPLWGGDEALISPAVYVDQLVAAGTQAFVPGVSVVDGQTQATMPLFDILEVERQTAEHPRTLVSTFDLSSGGGVPSDNEVLDIDIRFGNQAIVHFSTNAIYVLGDREDSSLWDSSTDVVKMDIEPGGAGVEFAAVGQFQGRLLDRFSIDEHDGFLRLATSNELRGEEVGIQVLQQQAGSLNLVGSVEDIAPGEQIFSTRFDGNRAFVVTFGPIERVFVDPLFVIDLTDPTQPTIQGELELPGYSNFLHVINEDYLLGVGRDADPLSGRHEELQVSLFNISDPADPLLVDRYSFEGGRSTWSALVESRRALGDHQAFNFIEDTGILALPFHKHPTWTIDTTGVGVEQSESSSGVRFFRIDLESGIDAVGDVEFSDKALRTVHFDNYMISMSATELKITDQIDPHQLFAELDLTASEHIAVGEVVVGRKYEAATDIDGDGVNSPLDALAMVNQFNAVGAGTMESLQSRISLQESDDIAKFDINGDGVFNPVDALLVINSLHAQSSPLPQMSFSDADRDDDAEESRNDQVDQVFAGIN